MNSQSTCCLCVPAFDNGIFKCLNCERVFYKTTHLESHPLTHLINLGIRNRYRSFRYGFVTFLFDLDWPENSGVNQTYKSVVRNVELRTNREYYRGEKLTTQEMWILNERKEESFQKYISAINENRDELRSLRQKMKESDNEEYYEERIERIEYCISSYEDDYDCYQQKYEIQEHNRNGTLQEYLDNLDDYYD